MIPRRSRPRGAGRRWAAAGLAFFALGASPAAARADDDDVPGVTGVPSGELHSDPTTAPSRSAWELAAEGGYYTPPIRGGTTPLGAGFGGRLGLSFLNGLYLGASVRGFLGGSDVDVTERSVLYGGELGYGFVLVRGAGGLALTLRPAFGAGGITVFRSQPSTTSTSTGSSGQSGSSGSRGRSDVVTSASGRSVSTSAVTVDAVSGASSTGSSGSSSASNTSTTSVTTFYVEPSATLQVTSGLGFVGLRGGLLIVPSFGYVGVEPETWLSYGAHFELGVRF